MTNVAVADAAAAVGILTEPSWTNVDKRRRPRLPTVAPDTWRCSSSFSVVAAVAAVAADKMQKLVSGVRQ